jgi:eukaryotic-like serine/threonine-protein kinase
MPLTPGTRLGAYEIIASIGAGGMGEVYRGRDTRLNRDVAIKVLPAALAGDPDRRARLEQEARAAAALSAPGIVAVHDIGAQTIDGRPVMYVVMELLDGESLRTRLEQGAIPPRKAAEYAAQIASALATAHLRGIVHRDLKPDNLFITRDGRIKILDFGLAKETTVAAASGSVATGVVDTAAGTVLGTVGYMAPEQVRGETADPRTDIFALGATLYEMLTARRAFSRATAAETMTAILNEDPPDMPPDMVAAVPGALQAILGRCLEKQPDDRFHSAHDLALALQAAGGRTTTSVERIVRAPSAFHRGAAIGAICLALGVLVGAAAIWLSQRPPDSAVVASLRQLTEAPGAEIDPDISPDGRQVVYASAASGALNLYLLRVGGGRAIDLSAPGHVNDSEGAFSPDGSQIAFRSDRDGGGIFVMGATGESVRRLTNEGFNPRWSPDGKRIAYATEPVDDPYSRAVRSELWTVDVASGQTTKLWNGDAVQPVWSPNGARIAFWANIGGQRDIETIAASGGSPIAVTNDPATDWAPEWSPDGRWLYFVSDRGGSPNLWRARVDESSGAVSGVPEPVTNGVRPIASARVARDGVRMILSALDRSFNLTLYDFDAAHPDRISPRSTLHSPTLGWCMPSKDASWLACTSRAGHEDIVLMRADGTETRRLTDDPERDRIATWSPDEKSLAFMSTRSGHWDLWRIGADGSGLRQLTATSNGDVVWPVWSPDGTRIVTAMTGFAPYVLRVLDPSRPASNNTVATIPAAERDDVNSWSSDGRLLVGSATDPSGAPIGIVVWDVRAGRILRRIDMPFERATAADAVFVHGTHDVILQTQEGVTLVDVDTGQSRLVLKGPPAAVVQMSGDGRTLLIEREALEGDLWLMEFRR